MTTATSGRVGLSLTIAGAVVAFSGRAYHVIARPEWTEPQALRELWATWLVSLLLIIGGAIVFYSAAWRK